MKTVPVRSGLDNFLYRILVFSHRLVRGLANRVLDARFLNARKYSNLLLRQYAPLFSGSVINVSGWNDTDREGGNYRDYFPNKKEYTVSNFSTAERGVGSMKGSGVREIVLDLNAPLPEQYKRSFDVVFNHTTLEHIENAEIAFRNLAEMSRDALILVVPAMQNFHIVKSYGDYWRMTPLAIGKFMLRYGFEPLVLVSNEQPFTPIYAFAIGVRDPKKYRGKIDPLRAFNFGVALYGTGVKEEYCESLMRGK
jgi:hypothetical protein